MLSRFPGNLVLFFSKEREKKKGGLSFFLRKRALRDSVCSQKTFILGAMLDRVKVIFTRVSLVLTNCLLS